MEGNWSTRRYSFLSVMISRLAWPPLKLWTAFRARLCGCLLILREVGNLQVWRQLKLIPYFEVSSTQVRRINGEEHGLESCLLSPLNQLSTMLLLFEQVELQNVRIISTFLCDIFERLGRKAGQSHRHFGLLACSCCTQLSI